MQLPAPLRLVSNLLRLVKFPRAKNSPVACFLTFLALLFSLALPTSLAWGAETIPAKVTYRHNDYPVSPEFYTRAEAEAWVFWYWGGSAGGGNIDNCFKQAAYSQ